MLVRAARLGQRAGLRFVYAGNLPGRVGEYEDTRCPTCRRTVVVRYGYLIKDYTLTADGRCPDCRTVLPGRWDQAFAPQQTAWPFLPSVSIAG
jgi:pyruvate formate lyase activating enzyme